MTSNTRILRFDHPNLRCRPGHNNEPMIPDVDVRMLTRMSAVGDMCRVVLPKRIAVDVIVVNPIGKAT